MPPGQLLRKVGVIVGLSVSESYILNYTYGCRSPDSTLVMEVSVTVKLSQAFGFKLTEDVSVLVHPCKYSVAKLLLPFWQLPNNYLTKYYHHSLDCGRAYSDLHLLRKK